MKKTGRFIIDMILALLLVVTLVIVVPNVFGVKTMVVQSGSMEPKIPTGSLVYVAPAAKKDIQIGDVISYILNEKGTVVTHRVVAIDEQDNFTMQGDANATVDAKPVRYENVVGRVRLTVPLVGYAMGFVKTAQGKILTVSGVAILILLVMLLGDNVTDKKTQVKPQVIKQRKVQANTQPGLWWYEPTPEKKPAVVAPPREKDWKQTLESMEAAQRAAVREYRERESVRFQMPVWEVGVRSHGA